MTTAGDITVILDGVTSVSFRSGVYDNPSVLARDALSLG